MSECGEAKKRSHKDKPVESYFKKLGNANIYATYASMFIGKKEGVSPATS